MWVRTLHLSLEKVAQKAIFSFLGIRMRVTVTSAIYPHFFEFLHVDIHSTGRTLSRPWSRQPNVVTSDIECAQLRTELYWRRHSTLQPQGLFAAKHLLALVFTVEFCTGAGAVKSRGKTAGVPREREERPPFIPRECRERDWLLRESRRIGSKRCSPPAGAGVTPGALVQASTPIVTAVRLMFTIIAVFIMLPIVGTLSTIFWMNTFLNVRTIICRMIWTTYLVHSWRWPWPLLGRFALGT